MRFSRSRAGIWRGEALSLGVDRSLMSSGHAPPVQARPRGIVPVLCPHNKREENVAIKAGEVPGDWKNKPSKTVPERPGCPVERGGSENSPGRLLK